MKNIKSKYLLIIIPITLISLMSGCASHKFPHIPPLYEKSKSQIASERAKYYFVKARDYDRRGLVKLAEHFYEQAYQLDGSSMILRRLLLEKYVETGKDAQALVMLKEIGDISELADKEKRIVAGVYLKLGKMKKAASILENMENVYAEDRLKIGYIYQITGEIEKAISNYSLYNETEDDKDIEIIKKIAELYIDIGKYNKAESVYVYLEKQFGERPDIFNGFGNVYLLKGDTSLALGCFETALLLDSLNSVGLKSKAQIMVHNAEYEKAIDCYKKLYKHDSLGVIYGRTLALLYFYNQKYSDAEKVIKELLSNDLNDYELHYYLGMIYSEQKQYDLAQIEFEKSLVLRKSFKEAWISYCIMYVKNKEYEKALEVSKRFVLKMPQSAAAWRIHGYVLNIRKRYSDAVAALKKAVNIDSADVQAWFELGSAWERQEHYDHAAEAFRRVLKISPMDHAAANYLGYMWAERGKKLDSAQILIEKAVSQMPENGAYLDSYAWVWFKKGDIKNAYKYIKKAVEYIKDDPVVYEHLGDILYAKGEREEAVGAYRLSIKAGAEDPKNIVRKIEKILDLE